jgi:hypothetical protein
MNVLECSVIVCTAMNFAAPVESVGVWSALVSELKLATADFNFLCSL